MAEAFRQNFDTMPYGYYGFTYSVGGSVLTLTTAHGDPYINMNGLGSFDPNTYKAMEIRWKAPAGVGIGRFQIYFLNSTYGSATEVQVVFSDWLTGTGGWVTTVVHMSDHVRWNSAYGNITGWRFDVGEAGGVTIDLDYIVLRSNTAPSPPAITYPANNTWIPTTTPTFTWSFSDPDAAGYQAAYNLEIANSAYSAVLYGTGWVYDSSARSFTLPSGILTNGSTYYVRMQVMDDFGQVNSVSTGTGDVNYSNNYFGVDTTAPVIGSVSPQQYKSTGGTFTAAALNVTDAIGISYVSVYMVRPDATYYPIQNASSVAPGQFTVTYTFPAAEQEGNWGIDFRAYDYAGNVSTMQRAYCYHDKTVPSLTKPNDVITTSPTSNTGTAALTATSTDAGSGINRVSAWWRKSTDNGSTYGAWSAENVTTPGSSNQYTYTFNRTNGFGKYHFQWRSYDNAGNVNGPLDTYYTIQSGLATLTTGVANSITASTSTLTGAVTTFDGGTVSQYGHVWSTSTAPTVALTTKTSLGAMAGPIAYSSSATGLSPVTTYYFRSYATTQYGTSYGPELSFTTAKAAQAAPSTPTSSSITSSSVVWSSTAGSMIVCNGQTKTTGSAWTGLSPNTAYTAYAYLPTTTTLLQSPNSANASATTSYSSATVTTSTPVTRGNTISISGSLTATGGGVTQHGHVWGTATAPTIALGTYSSLGARTGTGIFKSNIKNLASGTTYYIRAYATNGAGTVYGSEYTIKVTGVLGRLKKNSLNITGEVNERGPKVNTPVVYYPFDGTTDGYVSTTATLTENYLKDYGEFFLPVDAPIFSNEGCYFNGNNTCYLRTQTGGLPVALVFDKTKFLDVEIEFKADILGNYALASFYSGYNYASRYIFNLRLSSTGALIGTVGAAAKEPAEYHNNGWGISATSSALVTAGTWNTVRLTYDKQYLRLYVNGALSATTPALADVSLETTPGNGDWVTYRQRDIVNRWSTGLFIGADGAYTSNVSQVSNLANDYYANVPAWGGYNAFKGYLRNFKIRQSAPATLGSGASVSSKGLLVEEATTNVVTNTNLDTGWTKDNFLNITWNDIAPPDGIDSPVVSITGPSGGSGWYYSYGDYSPQADVTDYTISVYVKTEAPGQIQGLTAAAGENHGKWTNQIQVDPEEGWKRCVFNFVRTEVNNDTDSLDFVISIPSGKRMWLCAPQMEPRQFSTSYVIGSRSYPTASVTSIPFKPTAPISISLDYEVDSRTVTGSEQALFSFDNGSMDLNVLSLHQLGDGTFRLRSGTGLTNYKEVSAPVQTDGVHHFVVISMPTRLELWIDGVMMPGSYGGVAVPVIDATNIEYMRVGNGVNNNLIKNGSANLGDNTNFSSFVYVAGDSPDGQAGCLSRTSADSTVYSDEYIPVDPTRPYTLTGWFKGMAATSKLYYGVICFDKNKAVIPHNRVTHAGLTTLAQALKPGDTVVYLTSTTGWAAGTAGVYHYSKQFSWWITGNYQNYTYSDGTVGYVTLNTTAKTITLASAWTGTTLPVGTAVACSTDGGGYNYIAAGNVTVPTSWTQYTGTITGVGGGSGSLFRYGTRYVRLLFLINREGATTPTTRVGGMKFYDTSTNSSPANRPISNLAVYNRNLNTEEISALAKPKSSLKASGDLITKGIVEGPMGLQGGDLFYPLTVDSLDINHLNPPTTETNTIYDQNGVFIGASFKNLFYDVAPWTNNGGIITDVTLTEPGPIPNSKTWKFTKTGSASQWHGWEGPYGTLFTVTADSYVTVSGWYKTSAAAGVTAFTAAGLYTSDWTRAIFTTIAGDASIIADGQWHYFWRTSKASEAYTGALLVDGPSWGYSANAGELYINGVQWTNSTNLPYQNPSIPPNTTVGDSILKYTVPSIINANNDWTVGVIAKPNIWSMTTTTGNRFVPIAVGDYYVLGQSDACIGFKWGATATVASWQLVGYSNTATTYVSKYGSGSALSEQDYKDWALYVLKYNSTTDVMTAEIYGASGAIYTSNCTGQTMAGLNGIVRVGGYSWDEDCWDSYCKNLFIAPRLISTADLNAMWDTKMRFDKSGQTKVLGNIIEGQVL